MLHPLITTITVNITVVLKTLKLMKIMKVKQLEATELIMSDIINKNF